MTIVLKIILSFSIILVCSLITIAINSGEGSSKAPIFLVMGAVGAIGAVWKYKPEQKSDSTLDKQQLDKTSK